MEKTNTTPSTPFPFIVHVLKPYRGLFFLAVFFVFIASILNSSTPYLFKLIVDTALAGDTESFMRWIFIYPAVIALGYIFLRSSGYIGLKTFASIESHAYNILFKHLINHSQSFFSSRFAGTISSKVSRASSNTGSILESMLWHWFGSIIQLIIVVVLTALVNLWISTLFLATVIILILVNLFLIKYRRPLVVAYAQAQSNLTGATVDSITNVRTVQHFARLPYEIDTINRHVQTTKNLDIRQWKFSEHTLSINNLLIVLLVLGVASLLVFLLGNGTISAGDVVMVLTLLSGMLGTLTFIGAAMNGFIRMYGEIEEGLEQVLVKHDMVDAPDAKELVVTKGKIDIEHVRFAYEDATDRSPVFSNLTLSIAPGERIGLVGPSGAGKTSLISLLLRGHDVHDGTIRIDDTNIAEATMNSVRRAISFVPQDASLFHRTLKENIAYGNPDATDEDIIRAAKLAQAHDFIMDTPAGYETLVGERGVKLSGGQRQRVVIARAILKNSPILILDEATSALDSESEVLIQKALQELMRGKTVIAIAHRLSTLRSMDRIIVLDQGNIVEDGTHEELLTKDGLYQRLWEHQAGGFLQE